MNGLELYLLGRKLMKIGEDAIPKIGFHRLPTSVRSILLDVLEHPDSSIGDITARTGFPQSHVSTAVARLRDGGALDTTGDPADRRRTLVRAAHRPHTQAIPAPIHDALATALDTTDPTRIAELAAALDTLATLLANAPTPATPEPSSADRFSADRFDDAYATTPPWDIGHPQPAFRALADAGALRGHVLDIGCGTGEHALLAAQLGLPATGVDTSTTAIALAEAKAADRDLAARFLAWDALAVDELGDRFDTVLDCGLFHVLTDAQRPRFAAALHAATSPGGRYHLLCFSDAQPGTIGPRRISRAELADTFAAGWHVDAIEPAALELTGGATAQAWLATFTRTLVEGTQRD